MGKPQKDLEKQNHSSNNIIKYSGLGFQMLAMIGIATALGVILDKKLGMKSFPTFTFILILVAVIGAMISLIKSTKD